MTTMNTIEVKISDITLTNVGFAVFLKPKNSSDLRVVPIFIGPLETHSITSVLDKVTPPRPMTHDLMMMVIPALSGKVVKVTIDQIIDNTFYAKISLKKGEETFIIDARPSDSIAIALRAEAPIYITEDILNEAGVIMGGSEEETSDTSSEETTPAKNHLQVLEDSLQEAVQNEDYETAARLRDQIKQIIESS
jgi:uncharacterized protein